MASDWREVDRQLRRIARRRAAIDAEEAPWLLAAYRGAVHAELGHASFVEYVERVLGYGPRVAIDRLRVAEALEVLPATRAALAAGEAAYSAVRELTRVATPATEGAWLAAAAGKTVREVEELVSGHRHGDLPDDPTDPDLRPRVLRFEITPETFALFREVERRLAMELGHMLSDDELIATLCQAALTPTWARQHGTNVSADGRLADVRAMSAADATAAIAGSTSAAAATAVTAAIAGSTSVPPDVTAAIEGSTSAAAATAATAAIAGSTSVPPDVTAAIEGSTSVPAGATAATAGSTSVPAGATAATAARVREVPRYQVAVTVCASCKRGWQDGAGQAIEIGPAAIATAMCDAQVIGDATAAAPSGRRATRTIPPATRREVLRRDHRRCVVPGCRRSNQWIDVHHLVRRADGGGHDARNLVSACQQHHRQAHEGRLVITGEPGALKFHHADGRPWGAPPRDRDEPATPVRADEGPQREDLVRGALRKLGWSAGEAASATERARALIEDGAPIEAWIVAALRACRRSGP